MGTWTHILKTLALAVAAILIAASVHAHTPRECIPQSKKTATTFDRANRAYDALNAAIKTANAAVKARFDANLPVNVAALETMTSLTYAASTYLRTRADARFALVDFLSCRSKHRP